MACAPLSTPTAVAGAARSPVQERSTSVVSKPRGDTSAGILRSTRTTVVRAARAATSISGGVASTVSACAVPIVSHAGSCAAGLGGRVAPAQRARSASVRPIASAARTRRTAVRSETRAAEARRAVLPRGTAAERSVAPRERSAAERSAVRRDRTAARARARRSVRRTSARPARIDASTLLTTRPKRPSSVRATASADAIAPPAGSSPPSTWRAATSNAAPSPRPTRARIRPAATCPAS